MTFVSLPFDKQFILLATVLFGLTRISQGICLSQPVHQEMLKAQFKLMGYQRCDNTEKKSSIISKCI